MKKMYRMVNKTVNEVQRVPMFPTCQPCATTCVIPQPCNVCVQAQPCQPMNKDIIVPKTVQVQEEYEVPVVEYVDVVT